MRAASDIPPVQPAYVEPHAHRCDSKMLFLGDGARLEGLSAEVMLNGELYPIASPACVFIPTGLPHAVRLTGGSGKFINTVLHPNYNESLVGVK